jgi:hypothetical protein
VPSFYTILDCQEKLKGIFSEGAILRKKNTNREEYSKTQGSPFVLEIYGSSY